MPTDPGPEAMKVLLRITDAWTPGEVRTLTPIAVPPALLMQALLRIVPSKEVQVNAVLTVERAITRSIAPPCTVIAEPFAAWSRISRSRTSVAGPRKKAPQLAVSA